MSLFKGEVRLFGDSFCRRVWGTCLSWILLELFFFFFRLAAKLIGPKILCQFFKNCWFFPGYPLKSMSLFKGEVRLFGDSFCRRVWGTCLSWILLELFFFFFRLAAKLIGPKILCQFFKNCWFFPGYPLKSMSLFKGEVRLFGDSFCRRVWGTCLSWILLELFFFFFRLAAKLIGPKILCQFFKNCWFFPGYPLKSMSLFKGEVRLFGDSFCRRVWGTCLSWILLELFFFFFFAWPRSS